MKPDGTSEHIITTGYLVEGPTWAPNGRMIMFTKESPSSSTGRKSRIYSIDITCNLIQLKHYLETTTFCSYNLLLIYYIVNN